MISDIPIQRTINNSKSTNVFIISIPFVSELYYNQTILFVELLFKTIIWK